jgi:hypothetical protein
MIVTAIVYILYLYGFAPKDFATEIEQNPPSPLFLSRECGQGDSGRIGAASVQQICITYQQPTLFEGINSAFQ